MGSILAGLGAALGPILGDVAGGFGTEVTVYRPTQSSTTGGATKRTYSTPDPAWTGARAFFRPGDDDNARNASEVIAKPFGLRSVDRGLLVFVQDASGQLPVIAVGDGLKTLAGPFAGFTWIAEAPGVPDVMGVTLSVSVTSAPAGVLP